MRALMILILRRSWLVMLTLAIIGYGFAYAISMIATNNGVDDDPSKYDEAFWRIPLVLALFGFVFIAVGEILLALIRRTRKPTKDIADIVIPPANSTADVPLVDSPEKISPIDVPPEKGSP